VRDERVYKGLGTLRKRTSTIFKSSSTTTNIQIFQSSKKFFSTVLHTDTEQLQSKTMSSFTTTPIVNFGRGSGYNKGDDSDDEDSARPRVAVFVNRNGDDDDEENQEGRGSGYN